MRKLLESNHLLLLLYGCLLLFLASYFIIRELQVIAVLQHHMPYLFLVRFSLFWLVSLLLAATFYLVQLQAQNLLLKRADKVLAQRAALVTIALGIAGSIAIGLVLYFYHQYPAYFYI